MIGDPDTDLQADEVYNQILGEVGMTLNNEMATNTNQIAAPAQAAAQPENAVDSDLQARLAALKGQD